MIKVQTSHPSLEMDVIGLILNGPCHVQEQFAELHPDRHVAVAEQIHELIGH